VYIALSISILEGFVFSMVNFESERSERPAIKLDT
jgi:hypothetical protein